MIEGSLRAKQEKLQLDTQKANQAEQTSHIEEFPAVERSHEEANVEWQQFYEVIKGITKDMRY
ncbi:hypothetical protein FHS16_005044 [Paenibacillus endophyticus]|uniref:Uncharacterized protein n=1 Tax=Paenibacillus endophyticus TaxID=1294268 RepID=A0A7W5GCL1_9BACL|nr:hypothetical protein [Paenibacillus endophyticus]MBB3154945.1 hypothetical protein [Paenibacillus endophyticus]